MALNQFSFDYGKEFPSSWEFGKDVLDGFEQFMDTTPNLDPVVSYGAQRGQALPAQTNGRANSAETSDSHHEHTSKGRTSTERKQQNNRAAQKRFRERQKVRLFSTCDHLHDFRNSGCTAQQNDLQDLLLSSIPFD